MTDENISDIEKQANLKQILKGIKSEVSCIPSLFWFAGWLFSIGFIGIHGWKLLWSLLLWPYYLGAALR
jgi:hypothetical protein